MANISERANGSKFIQFRALDGTRRTLNLGLVSDKVAKRTLEAVQGLIDAAQYGLPTPPALEAWLVSLSDKAYERFVAVGLMPPRESAATHTVAVFVADWIEKRHPKPSTRLVWQRAGKWLQTYFGDDRPIQAITQEDCSDWQRYLQDSGLAEATVRKMCGVARQMFKSAVRAGLILSNPFEADGIRTAVRGNPKRMQFVSAADIERVLDACPDVCWRSIVALCRYGGLRCPSEVLAVRWSDVDWDRRRMRIPSPKTAHHEGREERWIPLFPELARVLEDAFDVADEGANLIINKRWDAQSNLRTQFQRIIRRAGVLPWPRLFHQLRASRQTELTDLHPAHVVSAWMGNSVQVAERHYLSVTDDHFERAAGVPEKALLKALHFDAKMGVNAISGDPGKAKNPLLSGVYASGGWTILDSNQ